MIICQTFGISLNIKELYLPKIGLKIVWSCLLFLEGTRSAEEAGNSVGIGAVLAVDKRACCLST